MAVANQNARVQFQAVSADVTVLAAADPTATLVAAKTNYTIYVTHISVSTTTDHAATLTFQDSATTPVVLAVSKASPGIGPAVWDFGDDGTPCTADKAFNLAASGAGRAARIHVEGYYKQSANLTA